MGSQLGLKSVLGLLVGPMAPPSGFLRAQGISADVGIILVSFGVTWDGKIGTKIGLEASGGPHGSPKGPLESPRVPFW